MNYEKQTQEYSTFGDKLLQHLDTLSELQKKKRWKPITVQLSPTGVCDFSCDFCSVKFRDKSLVLPFNWAKRGLKDFKSLGAKGLELSGGGNPLLYPQINELINYAHKLGYKIGLISNSPNPGKHLKKETAEKLTWYRSSLSGIDNGFEYDFSVIPEGKLGFSYIVNEKTTKANLLKIVKLIKTRPDTKFVRIAPNCLNPDEIKNFKKKWGKTIEKLGEKFFIKEIGDNFKAYPDFCGVGMIRPYCTEDGNIYTCSSYVLKERKYEDKHIIGHITNVKGMYKEANEQQRLFGSPYAVNPKDCYHCFYHNNNKLLHTIIKELPDKDFA